jgi:2-polyprenyl-6-methoxyphenol hydroxylase-like FAD-dependent oxidoreductase
VVILDRSPSGEDTIGETFPQAGRSSLERLGLWDDFEQEQRAWCRARRCAWGGPEPVDQEGGGDGLGWRLDRVAFEDQLRSAIVNSGVELIGSVGVTSISRDPVGWTLELVGRGYARPQKLRAKLVIDAGGRTSRNLRPYGQTRLAEDRLVCAWVHAPLTNEPPDHVYFESDPEGWWYSAALPDGRRLIAFYTDSDLPVTSQLLQNGLVERAKLSPGLSSAIGDCDLGEVTPVRFCAAHRARLDRASGEGWLAVGDAAICLDPLASHGLAIGLETGIKAASAARRLLAGVDGAAEDYEIEILGLWRASREQRAARYGLERRWPDSPFWQRRLSGA